MALCALVLAAGVPAASNAAEAGAPGVAAPAAGEAVTVEDLEALLAALENEAEREKLAAQLRALIAAQKAAEKRPESAGARAIDALSGWVDAASDQITAVAGALVDAPELFRWLGRQIGDREARGRVLTVLVKIVIILGAGLGAGRLARMALSRPRAAIEARTPETGLMRWLLLVARTALDLAPILAFAAVAYAVLPFTDPGAVTRAVALALVNAILLARVALAVARMVLAPQVASLRVVPLSDETAHYAYIWVRRLAKTAIYGYFAAEAALLLGLPEGGHATLLNLLGLLISLMLVTLIMQNRRPVANWIAGSGGAGPGESRLSTIQSLRRILAESWHILAIFYVIAIYLVGALRVEGGFAFVFTATALTLAILVAARLVAGLAGRLIDRAFSVSEDLTARFPTLEARANRYTPILHAVARVVVYGVAALSLMQVWGIDALAWITSEGGQRLVGSAVSIAFVIAAAVAVWEIAGLYIERYLSRLDAESGPAGHASRARTVLPVFRTGLLIVLVVIVSLIVLSELGINITPLLAGAGIVGIAVGFGAQKLVQDVINGLSLILANTIAVGDVVTLGDNSGLVEALSIRHIRLRDLAGNVHTIPLGEVGIILNRTRDFSYYLFDIGVAYKENVDRVIGVLQGIGAELQADAKFGPNILEPLEVLGLDSFADSAVMIKARIKTLPIKQWMVGREFNRRMKNRFDELGIEIPFPHRTVFFGEEGAEEAARFAAAAGVADVAGEAGSTSPESEGNGG
jgi:small conductance mechanosensitive channel